MVDIASIPLPLLLALALVLMPGCSGNFEVGLCCSAPPSMPCPSHYWRELGEGRREEGGGRRGERREERGERREEERGGSASVKPQMFWVGRPLPQVSEDAANSYNTATSAIKRGDYAEAQASLEAALTSSPSFPHALVALADVYLDTGRVSQAEEGYRRAFEKFPNFTPAGVWFAPGNTFECKHSHTYIHTYISIHWCMHSPTLPPINRNTCPPINHLGIHPLVRPLVLWDVFPPFITSKPKTLKPNKPYAGLGFIKP
jgi:hypothetical protein